MKSKLMKLDFIPLKTPTIKIEAKSILWLKINHKL